MTTRPWRRIRRHLAGVEEALGMTKALLEIETEPEVTAFLKRFVDAIERECVVVVTAFAQLNEGPGLVERALDAASNMAMEAKGRPTDRCSDPARMP